MKPDKELFLKADPHLTFSMNTQIKEQLKWLIGTGKIKPGEMLPPAQQLADTLNVNRNTVNLVYTQLRDEGIVGIQKGRGTDVLDNAIVIDLVNKRKPMYKLLEKMVAEAEEQHFDLEELATAGMAFVQLFGNKAIGKLKVLFIECKEHDHIFYRNEIEKYTGASVTSLFLEDIHGSGGTKLDEALSGADAVVTTLNHIDEVKDLVGTKKNIITIGATIDFSLLLDIAKLSPGTKVGFVCLGQKGGQWMAERAKDAGIKHIDPVIAGTNDMEQLQKVLKESDKIFASTAVFEDVKALAPDKAVHYPLLLEKSSEKLLADFAFENK
ncbi:GntR family transcriptional regulator [Paenibacillus alkalitolerans]|uniref:GntR family transcriptional regulator n=1 Tax=Paenibacillus alkalitolerans TaxID=2799335 RepID=UPI0018F37AE9|nr:GntR family transcriptional regulator [Paenibacillus alkalitolerans]